MESKFHHIHTSPFMELLAVPTSLASNPSYDIIIDNEINLENYCKALLNKIFTLPQSQFYAFINYQCTNVKDALKWLNKFEKLLANNEDIFSTNKAMSRFNKLYNLIEQKRIVVQSIIVKEAKPKVAKRYINAESEDRYFSFHELKKQIEILQTDNEKILLLTNEMYQYEQTNIEFINTKTPIYAEQCKKEIEQIYAMQKLRNDLVQTNKLNKSLQIPFNKLKFNCNINQFVDIFYQLYRELFDSGKPIIDGQVNDLVAVIVNSFVDKDGKELSPETVKTILNPSKSEKRPKPYKRIDLDGKLKK